MHISLFVLALTLQVAHTHDQAVKERGAHVMGFDQDHTVHHFRLHADGGAIDIAARDKGETATRDAVRSHLPYIAQEFADGNYSAPMLIHDTNVPGTAKMAALKNRIRFVYVETPTGGRLDIFSDDREALAAIHEFLRFQINDHGTGDTLAITKR